MNEHSLLARETVSFRALNNYYHRIAVDYFEVESSICSSY